jgi:WD40 repeat protein
VATARFADGGLWLWSATDGKQVRRLATSGGVHAIRFLPGGGRLVFAGSIRNDHNIHIHEVATGTEVLPPVGHLAAVNSVALAPAGQVAASAGDDLSVRLWDLDLVQQRHLLDAANVWGVGFHPDGKRVLFYGNSWSTLPFADVESGQSRSPNYNERHNGAIYSAAVTADGRYAVTGGYNDGTVRMWRLQDGRQVRRFSSEPSQGWTVVSVAPDMRRAIRVGGNRTQLLQLRCQEIKHEWGPVAWAPFLPDGRAVFFGGSTAPIWRITADQVEEQGQYNLDLNGAAQRSLSPDGKRAAAVVGGRVGVFELESGRQLWTWTPPEHFGGVRGVALSPDGGHLLTANGDGTVYIIQLP